MAETHTVADPFLCKNVEVSSRLVDRLRGRYACGPVTPSGEPEFGWRQFETPPIQHEAAAQIERMRAALEEIVRIKNDTLGPRGGIKPLEGQEHFDRGCRMAFYRCAEISRQALTHEQSVDPTPFVEGKTVLIGGLDIMSDGSVREIGPDGKEKS